MLVCGKIVRAKNHLLFNESPIVMYSRECGDLRIPVYKLIAKPTHAHWKRKDALY
jgi:hypothetical protein